MLPIGTSMYAVQGLTCATPLRRRSKKSGDKARIDCGSRATISGLPPA